MEGKGGPTPAYRHRAMLASPPAVCHPGGPRENAEVMAASVSHGAPPSTHCHRRRLCPARQRRGAPRLRSAEPGT
eukprot:1574888-Pyramimonas_sp.AAC.1